MADLSKLKRNRLGAPPPAEEASSNLSAPEVIESIAAVPTTSRAHALAPDPARHMANRIDGRSLRRTNRVIALGLRVTPEFDERLRVLAARDRLLLAEVLERALAAYEQQLRP